MDEIKSCSNCGRILYANENTICAYCALVGGDTEPLTAVDDFDSNVPLFCQDFQSESGGGGYYDDEWYDDDPNDFDYDAYWEHFAPPPSLWERIRRAVVNLRWRVIVWWHHNDPDFIPF